MFTFIQKLCRLCADTMRQCSLQIVLKQKKKKQKSIVHMINYMLYEQNNVNA